MIDFPDAPAVGQSHTSGFVVWIWDGAKWTSGPRVGGGGSAVEPSLPAFLTITGTTALPPGFQGVVLVANATAAPMTVSLPLIPTQGQAIEIKDTLGNAGTYPITVAPTPAQIDGNPNYTLASDFASVEVYWMGSQWGTR